MIRTIKNQQLQEGNVYAYEIGSDKHFTMLFHFLFPLSSFIFSDALFSLLPCSHKTPAVDLFADECVRFVCCYMNYMQCFDSMTIFEQQWQLLVFVFVCVLIGDYLCKTMFRSDLFERIITCAIAFLVLVALQMMTIKYILYSLLAYFLVHKCPFTIRFETEHWTILAGSSICTDLSK